MASIRFSVSITLSIVFWNVGAMLIWFGGGGALDCRAMFLLLICCFFIAPALSSSIAL